MSRWFAAVMLLLVILPASAARADEIQVKTSGGAEKIGALQQGETWYFSLSQLNTIIGGTLTWQQPGYSVSYQLGSNRFLFTVGSPYVNLNGVVSNIFMPARIIKGELYLPAKTFIPLLDQALADHITWDGDGRMIRFDPEWFNITDLAISPKANGLLIEIFMSDSLKFEIYKSETCWLNIEFPDGKINIAKMQSAVNRAFVQKINAFQFDKSAQLSLRLERSFKKYRTTYKTDPTRLQIAVEDESFVPDSMAAASTRIGPDEKVDVIVIDPGHGGGDFGAIGRSKSRTREKEITLEIARELAKLIRKDKRFQVIMTRTQDEAVPLARRAKIANDAHADLFLSIHCNASPKPVAHGFQVFYLAPAKNDSARAMAQFENAPFLVDEPKLETDQQGELAIILNDMIQTEFSTESADLAYMTDMEMRRKLNLTPRGVDHAGFIVLNQVFMPSILVESAFISNHDEERLLRSKDFRRQVAEAIYDALLRFKTKYEKL